MGKSRFAVGIMGKSRFWCRNCGNLFVGIMGTYFFRRNCGKITFFSFFNFAVGILGTSLNTRQRAGNQSCPFAFRNCGNFWKKIFIIRNCGKMTNATPFGIVGQFLFGILVYSPIYIYLECYAINTLAKKPCQPNWCGRCGKEAISRRQQNCSFSKLSPKEDVLQRFCHLRFRES
jgi:hypothetical protein